MSEEKTEEERPEETGETGVHTPWLVVIGSLIVAMSPAFFFANPLQLHMEGNSQSYWGIAVFASAILAGFAFFRDADFSWSRPRRFGVEVLAVFFIVSLVAMQVSLAVIFERWSSDMVGMRPVEELQKNIPLWAGCGFVAGLFWQGIFQRNFSPDTSAFVRVLLTAIAGVAVWAPFAINGGDNVVSHLLPSLAIGYALVAILNELGTPVWATMFWHGTFFAGLVWFRQALLL